MSIKQRFPVLSVEYSDFREFWITLEANIV